MGVGQRRRPRLPDGAWRLQPHRVTGYCCTTSTPVLCSSHSSPLYYMNYPADNKRGGGFGCQYISEEMRTLSLLILSLCHFCTLPARWCWTRLRSASIFVVSKVGQLYPRTQALFTPAFVACSTNCKQQMLW